MSNKVKITDEEIDALELALKGEPGEFEAWLEVRDEAEIKAMINAVIQKNRLEAYDDGFDAGCDFYNPDGSD